MTPTDADKSKARELVHYLCWCCADGDYEDCKRGGVGCLGFIAAALAEARRDGMRLSFDGIDSIVLEFGSNPALCLEYIGEYISKTEHYWRTGRHPDEEALP